MRPTTLASAMQYIQEENNIHYLQKGNNPQQNLSNKKPQFSTRNQPHSPQPSTSFQPSFRPQWQQTQQRPFPQGPVSLNPRQLPPQRYFTNQQVFGNPQRSENVWASKNTSQTRPTQMTTVNKNLNHPKPTPMSISSTLPVARRNSPNNFQRHTPQRNWTSEELFNCEQNDDQEYYISNPEINEYTENKNVKYDSVNDDENFHLDPNRNLSR